MIDASTDLSYLAQAVESRIHGAMIDTSAKALLASMIRTYLLENIPDGSLRLLRSVPDGFSLTPRWIHRGFLHSLTCLEVEDLDRMTPCCRLAGMVVGYDPKCVAHTCFRPTAAHLQPVGFEVASDGFLPHLEFDDIDQNIPIMSRHCCRA
mmetsp:Transcript_118711/g.378530  ORF Transcript_118711/g.378530 Transcript_118711/m.378530 type:complete len:151 (-) Transcript_118711:144-596(-)